MADFDLLKEVDRRIDKIFHALDIKQKELEAASKSNREDLDALSSKVDEKANRSEIDFGFLPEDMKAIILSLNDKVSKKYLEDLILKYAKVDNVLNLNDGKKLKDLIDNKVDDFEYSKTVDKLKLQIEQNLNYLNELRQIISDLEVKAQDEKFRVDKINNEYKEKNSFINQQIKEIKAQLEEILLHDEIKNVIEKIETTSSNIRNDVDLRLRVMEKKVDQYLANYEEQKEKFFTDAYTMLDEFKTSIDVRYQLINETLDAKLRKLSIGTDKASVIYNSKVDKTEFRDLQNRLDKILHFDASEHNIDLPLLNEVKTNLDIKFEKCKVIDLGSHNVEPDTKPNVPKPEPEETDKEPEPVDPKNDQLFNIITSKMNDMVDNTSTLLTRYFRPSNITNFKMNTNNFVKFLIRASDYKIHNTVADNTQAASYIRDFAKMFLMAVDRSTPNDIDKINKLSNEFLKPLNMRMLKPTSGSKELIELKEASLIKNNDNMFNIINNKINEFFAKYFIYEAAVKEYEIAREQADKAKEAVYDAGPENRNKAISLSTTANVRLTNKHEHMMKAADRLGDDIAMFDDYKNYPDIVKLIRRWKGEDNKQIVFTLDELKDLLLYLNQGVEGADKTKDTSLTNNDRFEIGKLIGMISYKTVMDMAAEEFYTSKDIWEPNEYIVKEGDLDFLNPSV